MPYMTYCPDSCLCSVTCRNAFELTGEGAFRFQTLADALDRVGILINLLKPGVLQQKSQHIFYT